jgi:carbon-monoxide dehydrogenase medium subunit
VKPAPFDYHAPETVAEVLDLLAGAGGDARLLAGGQSLVPLINMRMASPAVLIDLNRCAGLDGLAREGDAIVFGPMVRQRAAETAPQVATACPLLARAVAHMGHATVRNRGTVGGSLAHADPAAELPGVAVALGATLVAEGPGGRRSIAADDFFLAELSTALAPDEMLAEIRFPAAPPGSRAAFAEVGNHLGGLALVGVAGQATLDGDGRIATVVLAATGAGERPIRLRGAEATLVGEIPAAAAAAAADAAAGEIAPYDDVHASAHWRRRAVAAMVNAVLEDIAGRVGA